MRVKIERELTAPVLTPATSEFADPPALIVAPQPRIASMVITVALRAPPIARALMGASGFLTCIYALTKINYTYQIPILIGITLRGRPGDGAKFHQSNGLYLESVIQAIDIPFVPIEKADDIPRLATAYQHSRTLSRPVVVGFTREVLRGEA